EPFKWSVSVTVMLNLLMLGMLLLTLLRKRRHVVNALLLILCIVALAKFVTAAVLLKSWALLLWLNTEAMLGIFVGILLLVAASRLARAWLLWCAAGVALVYLVLAQWVLNSSMSPATMRLYQWNYGHLLNYNGLSQSISLILPFLMLGYLWQIRRLRK
ncbi:MAG: VanZ family protein, partial [Gallionellaceae bacterium]|nr:VanZ family protein [Gallionellaceae bacterium]